MNIIDYYGMSEYSHSTNGAGTHTDTLYVCPVGKIAKIKVSPISIAEAIIYGFAASEAIAIKKHYSAVSASTTGKLKIKGFDYIGTRGNVSITASIILDSTSSSNFEGSVTSISTTPPARSGFVMPILIAGDKIEIEIVIPAISTERMGYTYSFQIIEEDI